MKKTMMQIDCRDGFKGAQHMKKNRMQKMKKCVFARLIVALIILFVFDSIHTENVYANANTCYYLLISGMPECRYDLTLMERIFSRNRKGKKGRLLKLTYNSETYLGDGGENEDTWDYYIEAAFKGSDSSSTCYLYYSGHSVHTKGGKTGTGYALNGLDGKCREQYRYRDFLQTVDKYARGKVVLILDTCLAASIKDYISVVKNPKRYTIICSTRATEKQFSTLGSKQVSWYTMRLYNGCKSSKMIWDIDKSSYGSVTLGEVMNYTKYLPTQHPQKYGYDSTVLFKYCPTRIKLNQKSVALKVKGSVNLKASISGKKGTVNWSSSNPAVATVSSKGKVTGKKRGTATITASLNGAKATCKVKVTIPVSKITLNKTTASLAKGKTVTLKATVSPSNAVKKTIKWTSSNSKIATVSSKGVVKGIAKGTATITAKATDGSGKKATCKVTVNVQRLVTNITDTLLKKKPADAAKALGLTQKKKYMDDDIPRYYFLRNGKTRYDKAPVLEFFTRTNLGGYWNIDIRDTSVTFYGIKIGMPKSEVESIIKKTNWKCDYSSKDLLSYSRPLPFKLDATYDEANLGFEFKNGKLTLITYFTGSCYDN